jgi:hypothetical protein
MPLQSIHHSYISIPDPTSDIGVPTMRLTIDEMFHRFGQRGNYMNFRTIDERLLAIEEAKRCLDRLVVKSEKKSICAIS